MLHFIRQSRRHLRLWLLTAAALLALVSVIEAGHVHDLFSDLDSACALCQHGQTIGDAPAASQLPFAPLLVAIWIGVALVLAPTSRPTRFTPIRAPPLALPALH